MYEPIGSSCLRWQESEPAWARSSFGPVPRTVHRTTSTVHSTPYRATPYPTPPQTLHDSPFSPCKKRTKRGGEEGAGGSVWRRMLSSVPLVGRLFGTAEGEFPSSGETLSGRRRPRVTWEDETSPQEGTPRKIKVDSSFQPRLVLVDSATQTPERSAPSLPVEELPANVTTRMSPMNRTPAPYRNTSVVEGDMTTSLVGSSFPFTSTPLRKSSGRYGREDGYGPQMVGAASPYHPRPVPCAEDGLGTSRALSMARGPVPFATSPWMRQQQPMTAMRSPFSRGGSNRWGAEEWRIGEDYYGPPPRMMMGGYNNLRGGGGFDIRTPAQQKRMMLSRGYRALWKEAWMQGEIMGGNYLRPSRDDDEDDRKFFAKGMEIEKLRRASKECRKRKEEEAKAIEIESSSSEEVESSPVEVGKRKTTEDTKENIAVGVKVVEKKMGDPTSLQISPRKRKASTFDSEDASTSSKPRTEMTTPSPLSNGKTGEDENRGHSMDPKNAEEKETTDKPPAEVIPWWLQNADKPCLVGIEEDSFAPNADVEEKVEEGKTTTTAPTISLGQLGASSGGLFGLGSQTTTQLDFGGSLFGTFSSLSSTKEGVVKEKPKEDGVRTPWFGSSTAPSPTTELPTSTVATEEGSSVAAPTTTTTTTTAAASLVQEDTNKMAPAASTVETAQPTAPPAHSSFAVVFGGGTSTSAPMSSGSVLPTTSPLFSTTTTDTAKPSIPLFGSPTTISSITSSTVPAMATSSKPVSTLFGNVETAGQASAPMLFGSSTMSMASTAAPLSSLFGGGAVASSPNPSSILFGGTTGGGVTGAAGNLFSGLGGVRTADEQSKPSFFGTIPSTQSQSTSDQIFMNPVQKRGKAPEGNKSTTADFSISASPTDSVSSMKAMSSGAESVAMKINGETPTPSPPPPMFGGSTSASIFGGVSTSAASLGSLFGASAPSSSGAFGGTSVPNVFGGGSTPVGQAQTNIFGGSPFGAAASSPFGGGAASFGQPAVGGNLFSGQQPPPQQQPSEVPLNQLFSSQFTMPQGGDKPRFLKIRRKGR